MGRVDAAMRKAEAAAGAKPQPAAMAEQASAVADLALPSAVPYPPQAAPAPPTVKPAITIDDLDVTVARKVVVDRQMSQSAREQYRRLAASLHQAQSASGLKVILISSAVPEEGKTLTAANVALTLSESYRRRVLLIDADLRRPSLHKVFHVEGIPGLTENLVAAEDRTLSLRPISPTLFLLPAGTTATDPMRGLASPRLREILEEAREVYDWVIVDTPPVGVLPDANLIAASVDGIVFVVKAGSTPYDLVKRGIEAIGTDRLLGVVLNRAVIGAHRYGYGYHHYSAYQDSKPQEP